MKANILYINRKGIKCLQQSRTRDAKRIYFVSQYLFKRNLRLLEKPPGFIIGECKLNTLDKLYALLVVNSQDKLKNLLVNVVEVKKNERMD